MRSARQALDEIAALCDQEDRAGDVTGLASEIPVPRLRAVLADVAPDLPPDDRWSVGYHQGYRDGAASIHPMTAATLAAEYARGKQAAERDANEVARVTAKAVLDRVAFQPWAREVDLTKWRAEFGVES